MSTLFFICLLFLLEKELWIRALKTFFVTFFFGGEVVLQEFVISASTDLFCCILSAFLFVYSINHAEFVISASTDLFSCILSDFFVCLFNQSCFKFSLSCCVHSICGTLLSQLRFSFVLVGVY